MSSLGALVVAGLRGRRRAGVAVTFLVLTLAALSIAAGLTVSRQGGTLLDEAAGEIEVAHLVLYGDPDAIAAVAADPEVVAWSGPFPTLTDLELLAAEERVPFQLTGLAAPDIDVNRPLMRAGTWLAGSDQIVLDRSVGADLGIDVGDTITVAFEGELADFEVVGTAVSFTDCLYPQCEPARAWVDPTAFDRLDAADDVVGQAWLRFDDPAQADPFLERQVASGVTGIGGSESWLDTRSDFLILDRVFGSFVAAFGAFVLAVAAVVIAGSIAVRIVAQRRHIGLLGALGCTPRQIAAALLVENLAIGAAAAVLGWLLAGLAAPALQLGIGRTLGPQDPSWPGLTLLVALGTIAVLLTVASLPLALAAARRPVTDVLRDVPPDRASWINHRVARLPARLPLLGALETASRPLRAALAALAVVVAVVGVLVSAGFLGGVGAVADDPARAGDPWDLALLPGEVDEAEVAAALDDTAGIQRWYTEVHRRSTIEGGAFLSIGLGGDPASLGFHVVEGVAPTSADEAMAGYGFLQRFDLDVGDEVEVLAGSTPLRLRIVGMYRETEDSGEVLRYPVEALLATETAVPPDVYRLVLDDGTDPAVVSAALADRLGTGVRTEVLDTGVSDLGPLLAVLWLVAVVLVAMAGVNLLTTLVSATREAVGRIGVELAIGFTPRQIVGQGAVAGTVLGAVAAAIGVLVGAWLFRVLSDVASTSLGVGPGWMPAPGAVPVILTAVGAVVVAAAIGAAAVARTARRPASELLRRE